MSAVPDSVAQIMGPHVLIVEARFYEDIADELVRGAILALEAAGNTAYEKFLAGMTAGSHRRPDAA